jgi:hypothetical protein
MRSHYSLQHLAHLVQQTFLPQAGWNPVGARGFTRSDPADGLRQLSVRNP